MEINISAAVSPAAAYRGGKRFLAKRLIERIGEIPHIRYAEPFVGMGGVFLRRPSKARVEVINDISRDVANFFRILQRHHAAFMDMLRFQISSRDHFERLIATNADTLTDLERAARFLYLQRLAYGGRVTSRSFRVGERDPCRFDAVKLAPLLVALNDRLSGVIIESLDYTQFITRYDNPKTLFYIDPPYWGHESDYGKGVFARDDFAVLAAILGSLKGKFILSMNDRPEIRALFAGFRIEEVRTTYTTQRRGVTSHKAMELIISNTS